jgi:hypothetical protein
MIRRPTRWKKRQEARSCRFSAFGPGVGSAAIWREAWYLMAPGAGATEQSRILPRVHAMALVQLQRYPARVLAPDAYSAKTEMEGTRRWTAPVVTILGC